MLKKLLKNKMLFQQVKEFHYTFDVNDHHLADIHNDADFRQFIEGNFYQTICKNLVEEIRNSEEILIPSVSEIRTERIPGGFFTQISITLTLYKCLLNISEDVFKETGPSMFSIGGIRNDRTYT